MHGLIAYGAYIPRHRLAREQIGATLGISVPGGSRAVAGYDEDTTSMGVEAARAALRSVDRSLPRQLLYATTLPAYLDRTNAAVIHAALGLDRQVLSVDMLGSVRSAAGALVTAGRSPVPTLAVLSDMRIGRPGSADESEGGDAAAAFLFGTETDGTPVIAETLAVASTTDEVFDRWRAPESRTSQTWEERFAEPIYLDLAREAFDEALASAGLSTSDVDRLIVAGSHTRACRSFLAKSGVDKAARADTLASMTGNPGAAQAGLILADVLDTADPGQVIALVIIGDGAVCLVLRTTPALPEHRQQVPVRSQCAAARTLPYPLYLTWRGMLDREPPRRPDPLPPAAPPAHRAGSYKYAFFGGRCVACGAVNLPPRRFCVRCGAVDSSEEIPMADVPSTVATFTIDFLAFSPSPPVVGAVLDFENGGRLVCELTDVAADEVRVGLPVEMTFRRTHTTDGIHNYFWKARPRIHAAAAPGGD